MRAIGVSVRAGGLAAAVIGVLLHGTCVRADEVGCGDPRVHAARDTGLLLWRDCPDGAWTLVAVAGRGRAEYAGTIFSDGALLAVTPESVEDHDTVSVAGGRIDFRLRVSRGFDDRLVFAPLTEGRLYLDVAQPSGAGVFLGRTRLPVSDFPRRLGREGKRYNVVIIYTDDQRADTIRAMPRLTRLFADQGVTFTNAFDSTAACCPSRASLLSGGLSSRNTGVLANGPPNGGFERFDDTDTLATRLQEAGYRTLLVGKYMNGYRRGYVPPGWTRFVGEIIKYRDFVTTIGSSGPYASEAGAIVGPVGAYATDYARDVVLDFISEPASEPFFVLFSTFAPHEPAVPAPEDEHLFQDFEAEAVEETDLSDKPAWLSDPARRAEAKRPKPGFPAAQLRTLQAVDRAVEDIVARLAALGLEEDTVLFYASDDGWQWGEHGLWSKGHQYEASVRVPFLMRYPGIGGRTIDRLVIPDLDMPATVFDLANVEPRTDGRSVLPLLFRADSTARSHVPLARYDPLAFAGVRTERWKYVLSATGEEELYDLAADPDELESLHADPAHAARRDERRAIVEAERGLVMLLPGRQRAVAGEPVAIRLEALGGTPPYSWSIENGALPEGLVLDPASGVISGKAAASGTYPLLVRVRDSSARTIDGKPQDFAQELVIRVVTAR